MKAKKGKALKTKFLSKKPVIKNAIKPFKTKKQKKRKLSKKSSQTPVVKSVVPVEASGRVTEVLSQIHQLQTARPAVRSKPSPTDSPASPPPAAAPPLKKPRAERLAFLPPPTPQDAGDDSDADADAAQQQPTSAARGKKKRRKLKLAKRKLRQDEQLAAAETPEARLESARFRSAGGGGSKARIASGG